MAPLMGLSGTSEGPASLAQQVGGARDPVGLHLSQYSGKSHQGLHWDKKRQVWEQPRQELRSRGMEQTSWRQSEESSAQEHQASPACSPESGVTGTATHGVTAGGADKHQKWLQQLEVWAITEMVEATEAQLSEDKAREAEAEQSRRLRAAEQAPQ